MESESLDRWLPEPRILLTRVSGSTPLILSNIHVRERASTDLYDQLGASLPRQLSSRVRQPRPNASGMNDWS
jgi:hypothetical protein